MRDLLIIGGSDAGVSAALRARELDAGVRVTMLLADDYPNFSICGLPFFLSGEVRDWRALAHRTREELLGQGVRLHPRHTATAIRPEEKTVLAVGPDGERVFSYDRLLIATGAVSAKPSQIRGLDLPGVFSLRFMEDGLALAEHLARRPSASAIIVGGGYIGLEMADALTRRGVVVTLIGRSLLKTVDAEFGRLIREELERRGARVVSPEVAQTILARNDRLEIRGAGGFQGQADLVLVAAGARPAVDLARSAGLALGQGGAIAVDRRMRTSQPDILAAGDCAQTWHRLLGRPVYLPLGTTAHKQGRIAGENALGGEREYAGTLGTQAVKIFDLAVARTGLGQAEAQAAGFTPLTVETQAWDHKTYYPGAHRLRLRVTGDRATGRLLGAQILGHWQTGAAKRIDVFATAISHAMMVEDLNQLDLSYTPPLGSPWDPAQLSAQAWGRAALSKGEADA